MAVIPIRSGGGADTSFVTAIASDIRQGKVGVDVNGDPVNGSLTAAGVVSGNKALSSAEDNQFSIDVAEYATVSISGVGSSFIGSGIARKSDSGNVTLDVSTTSKGYAAGYYPNAHGAAITLQEKSATPATSAQNITPDSGKLLSKVSVGAIPNQKSDSGNVTLTSGAATKSYAAGYYANAHGATVPVYTGG